MAVGLIHVGALSRLCSVTPPADGCNEVMDSLLKIARDSIGGMCFTLAALVVLSRSKMSS